MIKVFPLYPLLFTSECRFTRAQFNKIFNIIIRSIILVSATMCLCASSSAALRSFTAKDPNSINYELVFLVFCRKEMALSTCGRFSQVLVVKTSGAVWPRKKLAGVNLSPYLDYTLLLAAAALVLSGLWYGPFSRHIPCLRRALASHEETSVCER